MREEKTRIHTDILRLGHVKSTVGRQILGTGVAVVGMG